MKRTLLIVAVALLAPLMMSSQDIKTKNIKIGSKIRGIVAYPAGQKAVLQPEGAYILSSRKQLQEYLTKYPEIEKDLNRIPSKSFVIELGSYSPSVYSQAGSFKATVSLRKTEEEDESAGDPGSGSGEDEKGWIDNPKPRNIPEDFEEPELCDETPEPEQGSEDMSGYAKDGEDSRIMMYDSTPDSLGHISRLLFVADLDYPRWDQISVECGDHVLELHYGVSH